jgi:hypothetical protein
LGLVPGTLDLRMLETLTFGPLHRWAISRRLRRLPGNISFSSLTASGRRHLDMEPADRSRLSAVISALVTLNEA